MPVMVAKWHRGMFVFCFPLSFSLSFNCRSKTRAPRCTGSKEGLATSFFANFFEKSTALCKDLGVEDSSRFARWLSIFFWIRTTLREKAERKTSRGDHLATISSHVYVDILSKHAGLEARPRMLSWGISLHPYSTFLLPFLHILCHPIFDINETVRTFVSVSHAFRNENTKPLLESACQRTVCFRK